MFRILCATAVFMLFLTLDAARAETIADHFVTLPSPRPVPDFIFEDDHGQSLRLSDFRGRAVLLNLWASWCGPCVEEMPSLDRLQTLMGDKLVVLALNEDRHGPETVAVFYKRYGISKLKIYDDPAARALSEFRVRGLPTTFLIGPDSNIIGYFEGATNWSQPAMQSFLQERLQLKQ